MIKSALFNFTQFSNLKDQIESKKGFTMSASIIVVRIPTCLKIDFKAKWEPNMYKTLVIQFLLSDIEHFEEKLTLQGYRNKKRSLARGFK